MALTQHIVFWYSDGSLVHLLSTSSAVFDDLFVLALAVIGERLRLLLLLLLLLAEAEAEVLHIHTLPTTTTTSISIKY